MASPELIRKVLEGNDRVRRLGKMLSTGDTGIPIIDNIPTKLLMKDVGALGKAATQGVADIADAVKVVNSAPPVAAPAAASASASDTLALGESIVAPTPATKKTPVVASKGTPKSSSTGTSEAAALVDAPAAETPITELQTTNPTSKYDYDLEKADFMVKALNKLGMYGPAQEIRKSYFDLDTRRASEVADNALVALQAGNIEPAIAAHNHLIGNGVTITGYGETADGKYALEYNNGKKITATPDGIAELLIQYKDPSFRSKVRMENLKAANDNVKEANKAKADAFKSDKAEAQTNSRLVYTNNKLDERQIKELAAKAVIEQLKTEGIPQYTPQIDGSVFYRKNGQLWRGEAVEEKDSIGNPVTRFKNTRVDPADSRPATLAPNTPANNQMGAFKTIIPGSN